MSVVIDSDNNNVTIVEEAINVTISTGGSDVSAVWGNITGDIEEQTDLIELFDDKVPYTGATTNVDLGEYELKAGQVKLDTSPTGTAAVGTIRWNDTTGTSETTLKGGSVIIKNGVDLVIRVVNKVTPNTTLTKAAYQVVKIGGAQGQRLAVGLAQANNDNNSADTIGIVIESIATNQEGFIMTVGSLEGINTTGSLQGETWSDGDVLYLSPTVAGRITNIKPVAPQHLVVVGYVEYAHANNGKIYVKIMNGWELGELHDVDTAGATNGQVLKYNGSIWVPGSDTAGISSIATSAPITGGTITTSGTIGITQATGSTDGYLSATDWTTFNSKQAALTLTTSGTSGAATFVGATLNIPQYQAVLTNPVTGTGASGQVSYWSGTGTQTGSNNLFWDNANGRLGVNRTPTDIFDVNLPLTADKISIYNATSTRFTLNGSGVLTWGANAISGAERGQLTWDTNISVINAITSLSLRTNFTNRLFINNTGRVLINSTTDNGQQFQVNGSTLLRGSGTTSATTALLVQNSTPTSIFEIKDNGRVEQTVTLGTNNTIFGKSAGQSGSLSGNFNTFFGTSAGSANTTASANTLIGSGAGQGLTTGGSNIYIGRDTGIANQTAAINTGIGVFALLNHTTGGQNIALGFDSGRRLADGVTNMTSMSNSVLIGHATYPLANGDTNEIVIGHSATGLGSNTTTIGNASTTNNYIYGNFNITDKNIIFGTTTGTKIGTATSQKLAFWNATPIVQPTTGIAEATFVENLGGTAVNVDSTFAGYTLQQIAQALKDLGILA